MSRHFIISKIHYYHLLLLPIDRSIDSDSDTAMSSNPRGHGQSLDRGRHQRHNTSNRGHHMQSSGSTNRN